MEFITVVIGVEVDQRASGIATARIFSAIIFSCAEFRFRQEAIGLRAFLSAAQLNMDFLKDLRLVGAAFLRVAPTGDFHVGSFWHRVRRPTRGPHVRIRLEVNGALQSQEGEIVRVGKVVVLRMRNPIDDRLVDFGSGRGGVQEPVVLAEHDFLDVMMSERHAVSRSQNPFGVYKGTSAKGRVPDAAQEPRLPRILINVGRMTAHNAGAVAFKAASANWT